MNHDYPGGDTRTRQRIYREHLAFTQGLCWFLANDPDVSEDVRRIVRDGVAYNEGFVFGGEDWAPFGVSYRALVPRLSECSNLLTPTCLSSSHVAYGAIRLEWTFMALGQAAATAACLALDDKAPVQRVNYAKLRARLLADKQVLVMR